MASKCPHCHKEINLGQLVVQNRWKGVSKEDRSKAMSKIAKGNKNRANGAKKKKE